MKTCREGLLTRRLGVAGMLSRLSGLTEQADPYPGRRDEQLANTEGKTMPKDEPEQAEEAAEEEQPAGAAGKDAAEGDPSEATDAAEEEPKDGAGDQEGDAVEGDPFAGPPPPPPIKLHGVTVKNVVLEPDNDHRLVLKLALTVAGDEADPKFQHLYPLKGDLVEIVILRRQPTGDDAPPGQRSFDEAEPGDSGQDEITNILTTPDRVEELGEAVCAALLQSQSHIALPEVGDYRFAILEVIGSDPVTFEALLACPMDEFGEGEYHEDLQRIEGRRVTLGDENGAAFVLSGPRVQIVIAAEDGVTGEGEAADPEAREEAEATE